MEIKNRKLGIGNIGALPWGRHLCYFYNTKKDLIDVLVPYFKAGLENNELCIWITSDPPTIKEAEAAMRKAVPDFPQYLASQQIEIIPHTKWYYQGGTFNRKRVLNAWINKLERAKTAGYDGVRASGDVACFARKDWNKLLKYEEEVNKDLSKHQILALCAYPLDKFKASEIMDVERNHHFSLFQYKDELFLLGIAEHKQEEEISHFLNSIPQKASEAVIATDINHRITYVNEAAQELFGYSAAELIGKNPEIVIAESSIQQCREDLFQTISSGRVWHGTILHRRKDGSTFTDACQISPLFDEKGDIKAYVSIRRDINEQELWEESLKKARDEAQKYLDIAGVIFLVINSEGKVTLINRKGCEILGYAEQEIIGKNWFDNFISPRVKSEVLSVSNKLLSGEIKSVAYYENPILTRSGEERIIAWHNTLLRDDNGNIISHLSSGEDITERRQIEETMRKTEENYRQLFDLSPAGVTTLNMKGVITSCNPAVYFNGGYSEEELVGKHFTEVASIRAKDIPKFTRMFKDILRGKAPEPFVAEYKRKDGTTGWTETHVSLLEEGGKKRGIQLFQKDITELKRTQEARGMLLESIAFRPITQLQERFTREGFKEFKDLEIIELLLSLVLPARKAKRLATACLERFQNLRDFLAASPEELQQIGITPACMFCIKLLHELPMKVLQQRITARSVYKSSREVFEYLYYAMRDLKNEVFKVIYLNSRSQIIDTVDLFEGTTDHIPIHPREIVESAIAHHAAGLIFVHNHPTGDPTPSRSDKQLTRDLVFIGNILQIKILDHIVIGENSYFSFADNGLIQKYDDNFLNLKIRGVLASRELYRHCRNTRPESFTINKK